MPHFYTEDQLVEQPAIGLFAELGWLRLSAFQNLRRTRDLLRLPALMVTMLVVLLHRHNTTTTPLLRRRYTSTASAPQKESATRAPML